MRLADSLCGGCRRCRLALLVLIGTALLAGSAYAQVTKTKVIVNVRNAAGTSYGQWSGLLPVDDLPHDVTISPSMYVEVTIRDEGATLCPGNEPATKWLVITKANLGTGVSQTDMLTITVAVPGRICEVIPPFFYSVVTGVGARHYTADGPAPANHEHGIKFNHELPLSGPGGIMLLIAVLFGVGAWSVRRRKGPADYPAT